jgi:thiamine biosynthesis lipoprotein
MKHVVLPLLFAGLLGPVNGGNLVRAEGSADTMGSVFSVVAWGEDQGHLESAIAAALDEARRLDEMLSNYKPSSELSEVNRRAAKGPVGVSDELFRLLETCDEYSRASEGTFDITVGPLMKVWGFYRGSGHFPHRAEILGALGHVGYQKMVLDAASRTVRFTEDGVELDPGGVGKGYAVDRMVEILKESGIKSALVSAGSSSIFALGAPPGEPGWKVAIKDPRDTTKSAATVTLRDQSLSTSGNYEKFFVAEGKVWSHIMDPRTGYPAMGTLSVSLITPQTIDSEIWAKPYYILGRQWTIQHMRKDFRVFFCEDKADSPCVWLQ